MSGGDHNQGEGRRWSTPTAPGRQQFCDLCDITLDLHPKPYDEDDPGCDSAEGKARIIEMFGVSS